MLVTSRLDFSSDYICHAHLADVYDPNSILRERTVDLQAPGIEHASSYQLYTDGLYILYTHLHFSRPAQDFFRIDGASIMLNFFVRGVAVGDLNPLNREHSFVGGAHNLRYAPQLDAVIGMAPHEPLHYVVILLSPAFYFRLLDRHAQLHQHFVAEVLRGQYTALAAQDLPITADMHQVLHDIRHCPRQGAPRRLRLESKLLELLGLQLEQQAAAARSPASSLRLEDYPKLEAGRALLETRYVAPPSLRELARLVGLNEFKLKQGFRERFGTSVRAYLIRVRLEQARRLLQDTDQPIGEVAAQVGYKSPAHFTAAFKTQFGILPSNLRR